MERVQLDTTNVLLGILVGLGAAQMIALVVAAIWLKRTVGHLSQAAARFESERVAPLLGEAQQLGNQARQLMTELQAAVHRASALVNGVELRTRRAMATVDSVNKAVGAVVNTVWSQVRRALESGLRRRVSALVRSTRRADAPVSGE
ncbi:MAG: hypothetical protein A3I61_16130 [Acidobacteria bacterium RIFCSPLOWO2_02_FULL_68_18]|nr:MAG: hypothetical protein A3I61_16130 [Acidobacteria bacterium RIFCSPLOWO2_02_FULL_68_18]OFW48961.1 MAG: hypothetical protein A3G77_05210 [Acidobacteria bacterium RIFCSPLOWO2_12_FULL_68_19]